MVELPARVSRIPPHAQRILALWLLSSAIAIPLIVLVLGPHLPPGNATAEASDQTSANIVLTAVCAPIVLLIAVYFGYALLVFRARGTQIEDGAPVRGHAPTQTLWLVLSSATVIALAVWGSLVLVVSAHGAGGGQGPDPIALPSGAKQALQVQVIGQQWNWTYRFPGYGGLETAGLELPADTLVEFHVTSLDVTHSFWAYELGRQGRRRAGRRQHRLRAHAEADLLLDPLRRAVRPLARAHVPDRPRRHREAFKSWIASEQQSESLNKKYLPPYDTHYYPEPQRRAG